MIIEFKKHPIVANFSHTKIVSKIANYYNNCNDDISRFKIDFIDTEDPIKKIMKNVFGKICDNILFNINFHTENTPLYRYIRDRLWIFNSSGFFISLNDATFSGFTPLRLPKDRLSFLLPQ